MAGTQSNAVQSEVSDVALILPAGSSPPRTPSPEAAADLPMKVALLSSFVSEETLPDLPAKITQWSGAEDMSDATSSSPVPPGLTRSVTSPADSGLSPWLCPPPGLPACPPPGLPAPVGMPSRGSALHHTGTCKPCAWFWKPKGCQNGKDCLHCHLCPDGEIKARKKSKLVMMRLGLATPKAMLTHSGQDAIHPAALSFGLPDLSADSASELESTAYSSFEQGSFASTGSKPSDFVSGPGSAGESASGSECDRQVSVREEAATCNSEAAGPQGMPAAVTVLNHGSVLHANGKCRPCAWFWKPSGCKNGWECNYCHVCSEGELKARKKSKEALMRTEAFVPQWNGLMQQEIPYVPSLPTWH
mmetsp:Transcript_146385/g.272600  ORF Transcript_146385/g.272600 Transcript_146385/m.272600 type:complete len:360 (-) Transcript_146385:198-1277(-)